MWNPEPRPGQLAFVKRDGLTVLATVLEVTDRTADGCWLGVVEYEDGLCGPARLDDVPRREPKRGLLDRLLDRLFGPPSNFSGNS